MTLNSGSTRSSSARSGAKTGVASIGNFVFHRACNAPACWEIVDIVFLSS